MKNFDQRSSGSPATHSPAGWTSGPWPESSRRSVPSASSTKSTGYGALRSKWAKRALTAFEVTTASLVVAWFLLSVENFFAQPEVHVRYATDECVAVFSSDPSHSCANLPNSYKTVWVY